MNPRALVFDAYGTLFDVHSVAQRCESFWPGAGARISQLWRAKQLEWTWRKPHAPLRAVFANHARCPRIRVRRAAGLPTRKRRTASCRRPGAALYPDVRARLPLRAARHKSQF
jgi:2-haloacid dehalogenase